MPLISVVTIVYNGVGEIEKTIKSVIGQTYNNIEYVIVDGGSTDGTIDIIKEYKEYIDSWKSEKDEGISDALNKGIEMISGDYVIFMNCGDVFYTDQIIKKVVPHMLSNPSAVVYGDAIAGDIIIKTNHNKILLNNYLSNPICHQAAFIPSEIQKKILYDKKYSYSMDYDLWHRLILKEGVNFEKIDIIVSEYMIGGVTSSINNLENVIYEHWLVKQLYMRSKNKSYDVILLLIRIIEAKAKMSSKSLFGDTLYEIVKRAIKGYANSKKK